MDRAEFWEREYNRPYIMAGTSKAPKERITFGGRIGKRIAAELQRRGWSQGQLAAKAHCTQPAISDLIHARNDDPKTSLLVAVAGALGVPLEEMIGRPRTPRDEAADPQTGALLHRISELWEKPRPSTPADR